MDKFRVLAEALEREARRRRAEEPVREVIWERAAYNRNLPLDPATVLNEQLHSACSDGNVTSVQSLLNEGADPSFKDQSSNTCLHIAIMFEHEQVLRVLLVRIC